MSSRCVIPLVCNAITEKCMINAFNNYGDDNTKSNS